MENFKDYEKNIRILLVEDDYHTQIKLVKILNRVYDDIVVAKNGDEALTIFRAYHLQNKSFDLVISDINMPIMDGINLLENVRQIDELLPFIFVTAQLDVDTLLKVVKLDIDNYILKPIDVNTLLQSIDKTIKKSFKRRFFATDKEKLYLNKELYWDPVEKSIYKKEEQIKLTKKEIMFLDMLCSRINQVVSTDDIIYTLWEDSLEIDSSISNLKNLISRIRIKIPNLNIENVYGLGYKLRMQHE
ncbi:response regulator transcription factor [Halarcobacter sp.]|uniref:response regulator transcription factor n=1 Tax=Halarcobacter sp. TaxID=2321133 RepID=UPI002AA68536|nr:response regulator transcription factor [Halarcobacter sp.]